MKWKVWGIVASIVSLRLCIGHGWGLGIGGHETLEWASGKDEHGTLERVSMHNVHNAMTKPAMLL